MSDNLYSVDRLVEFGMGFALAQQMVRTMNDSMQKMHIPGTMNPMERTRAQSYFVVQEGRSAGPFSEHELVRLIAEGKVTKETLVWRQGLPNWKSAVDVPDVLRLVALTPPPLPEGV